MDGKGIYKGIYTSSLVPSPLVGEGEDGGGMVSTPLIGLMTHPHPSLPPSRGKGLKWKVIKMCRYLCPQWGKELV